MDCYCDDGDGPSVFDERTVKAKKAHKCSECRGQIRPGEPYTKTWGIWDGEAYTFKRCPDCNSLMDWMEAHIKCVCWQYGETHGVILDACSEYERECPGLYAEAKGKIDAIRAVRRVTEPTTAGSAT